MKKQKDIEKVSIIVPVYNVEKFIKKCVNSLMNQTYKNIEIILVDDGSPDKCSMIIDDLSKKDDRIIVIHKKNGGVSSARNVGLSKSSGEYILFVDGDDYVDNDYVQFFVDLINYNKELNIGINYSKYSISDGKNEYSDFNIYNSEQVILDLYTEKLNVAVWNKIYRKSFLVSNNIQFEESIWFGEGMLFNIKCLQYTDSVAIGNKKVYHQVFNINSAMRSFNLKSNLCGIKSLEIQKTIWKTKSKKIEDAWNYHKRAFNLSILTGIIKTNTKDENKNYYYSCKKELRKNIIIPLKVNIPMKKKVLYLLAFLSPVMAAKISIIYEKIRVSKYKDDLINE